MAIDMTGIMNLDGNQGSTVVDHVDLNVSTKTVKIILGCVIIVDRVVLRKVTT